MQYIIILAVVVWAASWIARRKNPRLGVILSWAATGIALLGFILFFVNKFSS